MTRKSKKIKEETFAESLIKIHSKVYRNDKLLKDIESEKFVTVPRYTYKVKNGVVQELELISLALEIKK